MYSQTRLRSVDLEWLDDHGVALVKAVPGEVLRAIFPGDSVKVTATIEHKGAAVDDTFYVAIGNEIAGVFDEIWVGQSACSFGSDVDWVTYTLSAIVPITEVGLLPWTPGLFDLYVKIGTGLVPLVMGPELYNCIEVLLKPTFQNFTIVSYEKA